MKNLEKFHASIRRSHYLHSDGLLMSKVHKEWVKKVQRSYMSQHWTVMENLKKNLLDMTWGIWWIFTRALESLEIRPWWVSFVESILMWWLKDCREVMCNDTEEWCWIRSGIDLSFQKWHDQIGEVWPVRTIEISLKICILRGSFCPK